MRYVIVALALINGAWMAVDGAYVMMNGKYIGPERPGPWAALFGVTGIDVFKLGPLFVVYGLAWLLFAGSLAAGFGGSRVFGIVLSVLTLWYLPFGTLISIVVLLGLIFVFKN